MPLTPEQKAMLHSAVGKETPTSTSTNPTNNRLAEFDSFVSSIAPKPNYIERVGSAYKKTADDLTADIKTQAGEMNETITGEGNLIQKVDKYGKAAGRSALRSVGAVAEAAFHPITEALSPAIEKLLSAKGGLLNKDKSIAEQITPTIQKVDEWAKKNPEVAKDLEDIFNIATMGIGQNVVRKPLEQTVKGAVEVAENIPTAVKNIPESIKKTGTEYFTKKNVKDWEAPLQNPKPAYKDAKEIFNKAKAKGINVIKNISDRIGLTLEDAIEEGRYATKEVAKQIVKDNATLAHDVLRPALEAADFAVTRTGLDEVMEMAINIAKNSRDVDKADIIRDIKDAFSDARLGSLYDEYPDGFKLSELHDNKVRFASGQYNPTRPAKKTAERYISEAFGKLIRNKAPDNLKGDIDAFYRELEENYLTADFLESLNGKIVPRSSIQKFKDFATKTVGAGVGASIGGMGGGVGGYYIGRTVSNALEMMPNPIKKRFLDNLERTNPEAFENLKQYISEEELARMQRKALPEPSFIPVEPTSTPNAVSGRANAPAILKQEEQSFKSPTVGQTVKDFLQKNQGGFIEAGGYKGEKDLTTKILKDLEGKTTVSKQYILDATNRGELKQVEREITREILKTFKGDKIDVKEFANKVKAELLPLEAKTSGSSIKPNRTVDDYKFTPRYENIALPDELRGKIKDYRERIYNSPIKTSAGKTHFGSNASTDTADRYFGHTRIEDMTDNKTRRVIEVQSDLYQKGNLEREMPSGYEFSAPEITKALSPEDAQKYQEAMRINRESNVVLSSTRFTEAEKQPVRQAIETIERLEGKAVKIINEKRIKELKPLSQYNDPTAHFRMIREEIKKAAQDGKTKLQFPTGETAMKIEGLGDNVQFYDVARMNETRANGMASDLGRQNEALTYATLKPTELKVGQEVSQGAGNQWIITDVLGDGKFKAIQKNQIPKFEYMPSNQMTRFETYSGIRGTKEGRFTAEDWIRENANQGETFDISGKVDTNNPIYKFYEKDVQKFLNQFGGKKITDDKGVSWIEVPITKEMAKNPIQAFGKVDTGILFPVAIGSAGLVAGGALLNKKKKN